MVVPEDFMMGYQSVTDLTNYIRRSTFLPQVRDVAYRVVHRDTLFAEENQGILFPIQH
jgi:ribose transport system substrate-binding protein